MTQKSSYAVIHENGLWVLLNRDSTIILCRQSPTVSIQCVFGCPDKDCFLSKPGMHVRRIIVTVLGYMVLYIGLLNEVNTFGLLLVIL